MKKETELKPDHMKKAYHRPRLSIFGSIIQLTQQFQNGPTSDRGSNAMGPS